MPPGESGQLRRGVLTATVGVQNHLLGHLAAHRDDSPKPGMEYWIVPITANYTGDQTGHTAFDMSVKFAGSDNRTYDDRCGVIPTPLDDIGELYNGGVAEGNVCVAIPAGAQGLWTVSTGFGGKPVFFGR